MKKENLHYFTLITGASAGIGRALTIEGAKKGWNIALVALPGEDLKEFSESLEKTYQIKTVFFEIDLTGEKAPQLVYEWCQDRDIQLNRLINNAGVGMGDHFSIQLRRSGKKIRNKIRNRNFDSFFAYCFLNSLKYLIERIDFLFT